MRVVVIAERRISNCGLKSLCFRRRQVDEGDASINPHSAIRRSAI